MRKFSKRAYLKKIKHLSKEELLEALVREAEMRYEANETIHKMSMLFAGLFK